MGWRSIRPHRALGMPLRRCLRSYCTHLGDLHFLGRHVIPVRTLLWCDRGLSYHLSLIPLFCLFMSGWFAPQGGILIFSAYVGSDPASTVKPKKNIRNFKHPKKIFEILATPKNIRIMFLELKKDPKMHKNDPQTSPILR